jgi:recombinational DNA repair protein (RecF pathway)
MHDFTVPKHRLGGWLILHYFGWAFGVHDCHACGEAVKPKNLLGVLKMNGELTMWHSHAGCKKAFYHYINIRQSSGKESEKVNGKS